MPRIFHLAIAGSLLAVGIVAVTHGEAPPVEPTPAEAFRGSANFGGSGSVSKPALPDKKTSDYGANPFWGGRISPKDQAEIGVAVSPDSSNIRSIRRVVPRMRTVTEFVEESVSAEEQKAAFEYQATVQKVRSAPDDNARTAARQELTTLLDKIFQADLDRREKELAETEGRIRKLREQLDKRKAAKQQIIDLRVQTVVNEATGLDFSLPFESSPSMRQVSGGGGAFYWSPQTDTPTKGPKGQPEDPQPFGATYDPNSSSEKVAPKSNDSNGETSSEDSPALKPLPDPKAY